MHDILWGNVQTVREVMRALAQKAAVNGEQSEAQARIFVENKLAEIPRGDSFDALWDDLEFLYRKITAGAVEMIVQDDHDAARAFLGSAGMLLGMLKPELTDDERGEVLGRSLDQRMAERSAQ
ncbi:hypothetical protein GCM10010168_22370 [Actinoplanes ianthinogenes]|nr:hypothetical protein GCM10010168_22370 [Actinoplanes ianthinogenes]